ncbi:MAG: PLP-dependent aminotransferase family protein [Candidatus Omnitrophica bacterium]|nr:PLP-dependent aminotransferase family protein [Candidatus Omnitrophota bacterium]
MTSTATIQEDKKQYERVADHVRTLIDSGTLKPGDKIPSVRRMSRQRKVSITTVLEAYHRLEDSGLIKARPQSGYFVHPRVLDAAPEPSQKCSNCVPTEVTVSDRIYEVFSEASNSNFVQFGAATLHPSLLPLKTLGRISARLVRDHPEQAHSYDFPPGNPALRKEIAKRSLDSGCSLAPEEILLTSGGTEAIRLCLEAVTERGDVVGVESPTYYWFLEVIDRLGLKAVEIPTHPKKGIELEPLEELIERGEVDALLLVPTVSNPLGSTMPDEKKKRLAEIASAAKVPLIEDDIWGELSYQPFRPRTIKSFDREGWVLLCSAYSKTLAPGFRMGWTVPGRFYKEVMRRKISSTLSNDALSPWSSRNSFRPVVAIAISGASVVNWRIRSDGSPPPSWNPSPREPASHVPRAGVSSGSNFPKGSTPVTSMTAPPNAKSASSPATSFLQQAATPISPASTAGRNGRRGWKWGWRTWGGWRAR